MKAGPTRSDLSCPLSDGVRLCSLVFCTLQTASNMTCVFIWLLLSYVPTICVGFLCKGSILSCNVNSLCMIHCFNSHNYAIDRFTGRQRLARFASHLDDVAEWHCSCIDGTEFLKVHSL